MLPPIILLIYMINVFIMFIGPNPAQNITAMIIGAVTFLVFIPLTLSPNKVRKLWAISRSGALKVLACVVVCGLMMFGGLGVVAVLLVGWLTDMPIIETVPAVVSVALLFLTCKLVGMVAEHLYFGLTLNR
ncbi:MAG: hypothetical protein GC134_06015 [Proteobacteria bacterium]|nr:hypothetical protein [Pseudomonadota bacterium]